MDDDSRTKKQQRPGVIPVEGQGINILYIRSKFGILKIIEFVLLLISFASLIRYTSTRVENIHERRQNFFYFITITTWLLVLTIFLFFALNLNHRLNFNWNLVLMVYSTVTAFLLLLSSGLVLNVGLGFRHRMEHLKPYKHFVHICSVERCGNIEAAGAFGILSGLLFLIDAIFFFIKDSSSRAAPPSGAERF